MEDVAQILGCIHLKTGLVLWVLRDAWPGAFRGRSHDAEYSDDLVLVGGPGEERPTSVHFGHDAASGPYVDTRIVRSASKKDIGGAVPQSHDFVGKCVDGDAKGARQAKIAELQQPLAVDEKVLRLQVSMKHSVLVAEVDALEQLVHEGLDGGGLESTALAVRVHVSLKISIHVLEDEHELVLSVNDVVESNDILVFELLHERDLADGSRRGPFFRVEMDLLERDELAGLAIPALEDLRAQRQFHHRRSAPQGG